MNITPSRNKFHSASQTHKEPSDAELAKLSQNNEEARNLLVLKNMDMVKQAASYVVIEYGLNEQPEEFESIAIIKLLTPEIWKNKLSNVRGYIFRVAKNAIIDELRKDVRQKRFINQFDETSSTNKAKSLEEYLTDPHPDKTCEMIELEEEILKSIPLVYQSGGNQALIKQIVELSYGIDLGTNPDCEQLKGEEIAKRLDLNLGTMKTIKFMFNNVVRNRLRNNAA